MRAGGGIKARTNPLEYADILEKERRPYFNGKHLKLPGSNVILVTEVRAALVQDIPLSAYLS